MLSNMTYYGIVLSLIQNMITYCSLTLFRISEDVIFRSKRSGKLLSYP
jgi:hypothetical protein